MKRTNQPQFSLLQLELFEAINDLQSQLSLLVILLRAEQTAKQPAIAFDPSTGETFNGNSAWERVIAQIEEIEYRDEQDAREAYILPGVIGVSRTCIEQANRLNLAKNRFKLAFGAINQDATENKNSREARKQLVAKRTLTEMGFARLHLKQCYRNLVTLEAWPDRLGFTWTRTEKIERISVAKAYQMAARYKGHMNYALSLAKLDALDQREPLAFKENPHIHVRVNFLWKPTATHPRKTIQRRASLPILLLNETERTLPPISGLKTYKTKARQKRNDQRIENIAYVPLLNVYRYYSEYRQEEPVGESIP